MTLDRQGCLGRGRYCRLPMREVNEVIGFRQECGFWGDGVLPVALLPSAGVSPAAPENHGIRIPVGKPRIAEGHAVVTPPCVRCLLAAAAGQHQPGR